MTLRKISVIVAACDACGPGWWKDATGEPPHFENHAAARKLLVDEYGWTIVKQTDGRHRMYCPGCAGRSECDRDGCAWPKDQPEGDPARLQVCSRCGRVQRADTPPAGHPDTVVTGLAGWLAELDAIEWPAEPDGSAAAIADDPSATPESIEERQP
jgi:hypothetical protein